MQQILQINDNLFIFGLGVFLAGIASFFSPCIFPVLPIYVGVLIEDCGEKYISLFSFKIYLKPIIRTLLFVAGLSTVFILLGFGAGAFGSFINSKYLFLLMGVIIIFLGLHQMEIINFSFMQRQKKITLTKNQYQNYLGAYFLGLTFSFGWSPCIGPILSTILAITLTGNQAFLGAGLMSVYALGLTIPFIVISLLSTALIKN